MINFIQICMGCGGRCCFNANPPLSSRRIKILLDNGVSIDKIDFKKYPHPKARGDGYCIFFEDGKCIIHHIKPETCVAGPFTFDLRNSILEIYLKKDEICPLAKYLRENLEVYEKQFKLAVENITRLIEDLDDEVLAEILKIDEPETFKVAEIPLSLKRRFSTKL